MPKAERDLEEHFDRLFAEQEETGPAAEVSPVTLEDFDLERPLAKGCNAVVIAGKAKVTVEEDKMEDKTPLAIKMMFNYEAESNAFAILNVMQK